MPKKTAGAPGPQVGPGGHALSSVQWLQIAALAGVGVGTTFAIASHSKLNDVQTTAAKADADALQAAANAAAATAAANQADADAKAAAAAALQAAAVASEACKLKSPSDPACVVH